MATKLTRKERVRSFEELIRKQTGRAVHPYRMDGYVNMLNSYGTKKDSTEHYNFEQEAPVPDDTLVSFYEGNGLFAKIIDTPAEEALKHGFTLEGLKDKKAENFYMEALDELDWEENAMTAIKWARLFGGSLIVLLVDDGRGLDEPLDWRNIKSVESMRVFDRSIVMPDAGSVYKYERDDPFRVRGANMGEPKYYYVASKYGNFTVHESRCLVFRNGLLPENTTNSVYQQWGMPEYIRINRAIRDSEVAHGSAVKMLDKSIQAVYTMKDLAAELATEDGEQRVLRRLETIDMARGLLNTITIDSEGEGYDFRQFQYTGVSQIIDSTCNYLSALTNIPQTVLFGRSPSGMNATGQGDLENYYNFVERIQKRMVRANLRHLLAILFRAAINSGEIEEMPDINVKFNQLWSMSELEQAQLEQQKVGIQMTRAQIASAYVQIQALDPTEVRKALADSGEYDIESLLDDVPEDELFPEENFPDGPPKYGAQQQGGAGGEDPMAAMMAQMGGGAPEGGPEGGAPEQGGMPPMGGAPEQGGAPDMKPEVEKDADDTEKPKVSSVGVVIVKDGKFLTAVRTGDGEHNGTIGGAGGHIEKGETAKQAAVRETQEEFGITPKELVYMGVGGQEKNKLRPAIYLCTDYEGKIKCDETEMTNPRWRSYDELQEIEFLLFEPFWNGINQVLETLVLSDLEDNIDKSPKSDIIIDGEKDHFDDNDWDENKHPRNPDGTFGSGGNSAANRPIESKPKKSKKSQKSKPLSPDDNPKSEPIVLGTARQGYVNIYPTGINYPCHGFDNGETIDDHYQKHVIEKKEPAFQINGKPMTKKQYVDTINELFQSPVGGDVDGFAVKEGDLVYIARFNYKTGLFVKAAPNGRIKTLFCPKYKDGDSMQDFLFKAANYFETQKRLSEGATK